jgi:hypothetical protein
MLQQIHSTPEGSNKNFRCQPEECRVASCIGKQTVNTLCYVKACLLKSARQYALSRCYEYEFATHACETRQTFIVSALKEGEHDGVNRKLMKVSIVAFCLEGPL